MAYFTPVGAKFQMSTTFGSPIAVNSTTNADPAVMTTAVAHALTEGKEFMAKFDGWEDVNESIYRAGAGTTGSSIVVPSIDSSDNQWFPPGDASKGTVREVTNWMDIGQVLEFNQSGGGVKNITVQPINSRRAINLPAGFEAESVDMVLGFDPSRTDQKLMQKISRNLNQKVGFRFLISGLIVYAYGTLQSASTPQMASNDVMKQRVNLNFIGVPSVYVAP